jgi:hypothetical protein
MWLILRGSKRYARPSKEPPFREAEGLAAGSDHVVQDSNVDQL